VALEIQSHAQRAGLKGWFSLARFGGIGGVAQVSVAKPRSLGPLN